MRRIICNPLNLEYRYQVKKSPLNTGMYREAADPTMVVYKDKYLLFASMSGGFWYSDDLCYWQYEATPELPVYDYAPDVHVIGDKVVFCASNRDHKCGIYVSDDPLTKPFVQVSQPLKFWDPAIFQDDDGRVYLYWGCSTREPIWGIELDVKTMMPIGKKTAIIHEQETVHGWERVGENNKLEPPKTFGDKLIRFALGTKPCIEGAFMTKHNGLYYMQYCNNSDTSRKGSHSIVSEQAMREIYYKVFEVAISVHMPTCVMTSYNAVNGIYPAENSQVMQDLVRGEWGFEGLIMTDWGTYDTVDPVEMVKAGNCWLTEGSPKYSKILAKAVRDGRLSRSVLENNVRYIIELLLKKA